jgi:four helix bundle protein
MELVKEIYRESNSFPDTEKYGLINQIRRSAISIPSNIAEGASRSSEKEFGRFLEISLGSSFELETQWILSFQLNYTKESQFHKVNSNINSIQKQLSGLRSSLKNS